MIVTVTGASDESRSTKPLSSVWNHYTATKSSETNKKLACCNYCRKELYPHCDRMKRHLHICVSLGNECKAQGISRTDLLADLVEKNSGPGGRKKCTISSSSETIHLKPDEMDQQVLFETTENGDAAKLLNLNQLFKTKKTVSESTSLAKKPIKKFTDQDFDRETKELTVKKLRLDVKLKEEQSKLCQQISKGFTRIMQAVDVFLATNDVQPRVTVYAQAAPADGDPSSILHTAYETTVNDGASVSGEHAEITIQQEHKN